VWPSSSIVLQNEHVVWPLTQRSPTSALAADAITFDIIWLTTWIAPLRGGLLDPSPRKKYPHTCDRALASDK
jgi:hypothetical protein